MKRLQRYILLNLLKAFVPAFAALVLLMAVGVCLQLLHEGLDVARLASLTRLVFAYSVPMVLPSAFLTAIILTFGRLAADNELTAVRAAGIHMFRAVHPVLGAACLLAVGAAYFQFETVPRAQGTLRALKYEALKQILLDKAALSWARRFSFPPVHIMYDDFRDGVMHNVIVLETSTRRPRSITTARTATIEEDVARPERIVFRMNDCVTTYIEPQEGSEPQAVKSTPIIYYIQAVATPEDVLSRRRYKPLLGLIDDVRRLRAAVAAQPHLEDPDAVREELRDRLNVLAIEANEHEKTLATKRNKYYDLAELEPQKLANEKAGALAAVADAREALAQWVPQREQCEAELAKDPDMARQATLMGNLARILASIGDCNRQIELAEARIKEVERELAGHLATAKKLAAEIDDLVQDSERLAGKRNAIRRQLRVADDQRDLREIRIRIHKRLSQALSVFTFALLGIPLGIAGGGRHVMVAFGLSFAIVLLVFYPLLILGRVAAEAGTLPLVPAMWGGNILTLAIGGILSVKVLTR
jgi:lipopolysaccharide export LptBFGC system permease protein LptF